MSNEGGMIKMFEFPTFLLQYGSDDHAEFLCVVSREVASNATDENGPQHTDKAKVNKFVIEPKHFSLKVLTFLDNFVQ